MPISLIVALFALIALGAWVFFRFYSKHYVGEDAPEQSAQVTILDKQAIDIPDAPRPRILDLCPARFYWP